jgi:DUF4097 and DUF4098 domain-containing protein YvlB
MIQAAEVTPDRPSRESDHLAAGEVADTEKTKADQGAVHREKRRQVVKDVVTKSFKTGRAPHLVIDAFNGSIDLAADTEDHVEVRVTKRGAGESEEVAQAELKNIDLDMVQDGENIRVTAKQRAEVQQINSGASAEVRAPLGAVVELRTSNGEVRLRGGSAKADIQTTNAEIEVKHRTGPLHLTTCNGDITITGGRGSIDLNTCNGAITVEADQAKLTAYTSNGSIKFQGTLARGEHSLHTTNDNIDLAVPANAQFRFDAEASRGHIANALSKDWPLGKARNRLAGTVGQNLSTFIELRTSDGNIALRPQNQPVRGQVQALGSHSGSVSMARNPL